MEGCRRGNVKAQTRVYELYYKAMYNTSLRILNDQYLAEDIMQESFISAFQKLDSFRGEVSFGAWLKRIVINKSINETKRRQLDWTLYDEVPEEMEEEAELYLDTSRLESVYRCLKALPDGFRIILSLYLLEGYDHEEIGSILNISSSTSRSQYARARKRLKEAVLKSERNARGF